MKPVFPPAALVGAASTFVCFRYPLRIFLILAFFPVSLALAEIYKATDAEGNVTFSDIVPTETISEKMVNPEQKNVTDSAREVKDRQAEWLTEAQQQRKEKEARKNKNLTVYNRSLKQWKSEYRAAKQALKDAQSAFKTGIVVSEGDFVGRAGGGARPSEQYFAKEQALIDAVKEAKHNLSQIKANKPKLP